MEDLKSKNTPLRYFLCMCFIFSTCLYAQRNEGDMRMENLPPLLEDDSGNPIVTRLQWMHRRAELVGEFEKLVYGKTPTENFDVMISKKKQNELHYGKVDIVMEQVELFLSNDSTENPIKVDVLIFRPKGKKVPTFLGINSYGNHTVHSDPNIELEMNWVKNKPEFDIFNHTATETSRGVHSSRWPVERIVGRGYGLATFNIVGIYPDRPNGSAESALRHFNNYHADSQEAVGAIGLWAWSMSRVLDYLIEHPQIQGDKVFAIGHSRRGKSALWATAQDQRFAGVFANNTGCAGAALSMRKVGETIKDINESFPHWFSDNFKKFNDKEETLPIDQHMLLALVAPRPLYVSSAEQDLWSDPEGEFFSTCIASEVYGLYGMKGLNDCVMPELNDSLIIGNIGYHIRSGVHDLTRYDWERYMDFADVHFNKNEK